MAQSNNIHTSILLCTWSTWYVCSVPLHLSSLFLPLCSLVLFRPRCLWIILMTAFFSHYVDVVKFYTNVYHFCISERWFNGAHLSTLITFVFFHSFDAIIADTAVNECVQIIFVDYTIQLPLESRQFRVSISRNAMQWLRERTVLRMLFSYICTACCCCCCCSIIFADRCFALTDTIEKDTSLARGRYRIRESRIPLVYRSGDFCKLKHEDWKPRKFSVPQIRSNKREDRARNTACHAYA